MSRRFLAHAAVLMMTTLFLTCLFSGRPAAGSKEPQEKTATGNDVFGLAKRWALHLEMSAKEYEAMQPPKGGEFGAGPGGPLQPAKDKLVGHSAG